MNSRPLTKPESSRLRVLNEAGLESILLFVTATGLAKNILDATAPIRELLHKFGFHCYQTQGQGSEHKVSREVVLYDQGNQVGVSMSMYRPKTKSGDPRFWLSRLGRFAEPDDVLALFMHDGVPHFVNLTQSDKADREGVETDFDRLMESLRLSYEAIADELLGRLRALAAAGPIPADGSGDTSIGRTLETALGIAINSSPLPDYKGIEIKAKRARSTTRNGLFAKVPDWQISSIGGFREMLDKYGYASASGPRLFCTVSAKAPNAQRLVLRVDEEEGMLHELCRSKERDEPVCVWRLEGLHDKLQEKHRETFWVGANELLIGSKRHFELTQVTHTRRPSNIHFDRLLAEGRITVDHMIKMLPTRAHERGPQFKVRRQELHDLFLGAPRTHLLA